MAISNEELQTAKMNLRREIKRALKQSDPDDRLRWSRMICDKVQTTDAWTQCSDVLLFHPMGEEVDTTGLISAADAAGKHVYLPRIDDIHMHFHLLTTEGLEKHSYGMMEPPQESPLWSASRDGGEDATLIVCPGLGFDRSGGRLGRGKAFYDKFLASTLDSERRIVIMGICFEVQMVELVPTGPYDHEMQIIVTERSILPLSS